MADPSPSVFPCLRYCSLWLARRLALPLVGVVENGSTTVRVAPQRSKSQPWGPPLTGPPHKARITAWRLQGFRPAWNGSQFQGSALSPRLP